ncbi:MAG: hypothetical protein P8Y02_05495 [Deinococcales bacterium]
MAHPPSDNQHRVSDPEHGPVGGTQASQAAPATTAAAAAAHPTGRWGTLAIVGMGVFMATLDAAFGVVTSLVRGPETVARRS